MECTRPNAIDRKSVNDIEWLGSSEGDVNLIYAKSRNRNRATPLTIPCGKCEACRTNQNRALAGRLIAEAQTAPGPNWFITATYNDENVPQDGDGHGTLSVEDAMELINKIRAKDKKIKYYVRGHYGETNHRPHYHIIIYNWDIDQSKLIRMWNTKRGNDQYNLSELAIMWNKGIIRIAPAHNNAIAYTAGYATIELRTKGRICERQSEPFHKQTPGIGKDYWEQNWEHMTKENQFTYGSMGKQVRLELPTYYKNLLKREHRDEYFELQLRRWELQKKKRIKQDDIKQSILKTAAAQQRAAMKGTK